MNKKFGAVLLSLILLMGLALLPGCASEPPEETDNLTDYPVKLFFVNEEYVITGDETLERLMPAEEVTIESEPADIAKAVVEALKTVPDKEGYGTMITAEMTINKVYVEGNTAFVDLGAQNLSGSSTQEGFLINQIVRTLRESFTEVEQVQFLVDGEIVESLMGHIAADKPFTE